MAFIEGKVERTSDKKNSAYAAKAGNTRPNPFFSEARRATSSTNMVVGASTLADVIGEKVPSGASQSLEDDVDTKEAAVSQLPELESQSVAVGSASEQTPAMKRRSILQLIVLCMSIYVSGWNDGTLGPLLPRLQTYYHVGYTVVSLIFLVSCVGSIVGSCTYLYMTERFGFGSVLVMATISLIAAYCLEAASVPFPVFVLSYFLNGYGEAHINAASNAFIASLGVGTASTRMGFLHATYGLGAMCSPLVTTQFASRRRWSFVYLTHIGICTFVALMQAAVFRFRTQEQCFEEIGQPPPEQSEGLLERYKKVFRLRSVHLMALFAFTYVGHEVTVGSWIVTFIINERHGGPSSGYISSGFFGGLMVGRLALLPFSKLIGERRVVFVYILAVVGLELVVWLVPSLLAGAISVSFVGFFLGPIYPILMNHAGRILPPNLISGSIGWVGSWGAAGAAVFPFVTGAIASKAGIWSMQPLSIAMMSLLFVMWICVPGTRQQLK